VSLPYAILLVIAVVASVIAAMASIGAWPDIKDVRDRLAIKVVDRPEPRILFTDRARCASCGQFIDPAEPPVQVNTVIEMFLGKQVPVALNICQTCQRTPRAVIDANANHPGDE
jgi:hypothetical protein